MDQFSASLFGQSFPIKEIMGVVFVLRPKRGDGKNIDNICAAASKATDQGGTTFGKHFVRPLSALPYRKSTKVHAGDSGT